MSVLSLRRFGHRSAPCVVVTGIADEDGLFLHRMPALRPCGAGIDGMPEVEAAADGVAFDYLYAHGSRALM